MSDQTPKSFSFSFYTTLWITVLSSLGLVLVELIFFELNLKTLLFFAIGIFVVSFLFIQIRLENYIYSHIKKLNKNVSLLADLPLNEDRITTDMQSLSQKVEDFAESKKLEIEALKIREDYRREFIGNISHELKTPLFTIEGYILSLMDGAIKEEDRAEK